MMHRRFSVYIHIIKPIADVLVALIVFAILSPVFIFLTIRLLIANKGRPFFLQTRPGKYGRLFKVVKFKTMNDAKDKNGELLPDVQRITSIGRYVRSSSLDELPQLINVIKGDMSFVGPRPLLVEYLPLYSDVQIRRHEVKPGITGWAQINGRNAIAWKEKFAYDVWYVDNISFTLDFGILWRTFKKVFKSEGISSATSVTMEKFTGN